MLLNQLVEINQKGLVARAVSFGLMDDVEKNLRLCEGFVFNHDSDRNSAKQTTVGIFDAIRRSFYSSSEPNVHLIVQDYGKGKSHFALAVANFFKLPFDRPEVAGILDQIKCATSENNTTLQELTIYKQRGRHLVLCLSATDVINMQKHFFEVLNKELEANGITDAIAQQICREPLQFLQRLDNSQRQKAEEYLRKDFSTNIFDLENRLSNHDFQVIPTVKKVCREITGVNPDFSSDIRVGEIFDDLVSKLCKGENAPFQGILILFDELHAYLQKWATDPTGAGGWFLQNVTDACEKYKGKVALVSLTQRRPSGYRPSKNHEDYTKLSSRLETPSTYNPKASLELVLDGLLKQQPTDSDIWRSFEKKWGNHLRTVSTEIFTKYASEYYKGLNWKHEDFYKHLAIGCFPVHPLTSYLLCNLAFTQDRSAIDFIQKDVQDFISGRPVEENGQLNFIYPIALVEAFEGNFANAEANPQYISAFSDYISALSKVQASSDFEPDEIAILKALLLFYTSSGRLKKSDREKHEEVLKSLTGLTAIRISEVIQKLCRVREVIYHSDGDNTYRFYSGGKGIDEVRQKVKEESKYQIKSISTVEKYCNENIAIYARATTTPTQFTDIKKLRSEDWFFSNQVFSIKNFYSLLQKKQPFKTPDQAGLVAYVIAETEEEISQLYKDINKLVELHPYRDQIAVAIAAQPVETIAQLLLERRIANDPSKFSSQEYGAALNKLKEEYEKQVKNSAKDLFTSFTYYAHITDEIPLGDRTDISIVVSEILERSYSLIPPIEKNDKLYLKSNDGSQVIGYVAKRLFEDDLRPQVFPNAKYKNIVEPVFERSWGLLRLVNHQYKVTIPSQPSVRKAWDKLSQLTDLGDLPEKQVQLTQIWNTLSAPPYGYNAYTFTILLAGWMAFHPSEIFLEGIFGIPQKKTEQIKIRIEPLKSWGGTNILDKPKDFVSEWILKSNPRLIRRKPSILPIVPEALDYDQAIELRNQVFTFFITNSSHKFQKLTEQDQSLERACLRLEQDFEPVSRIERLIESKSISEWSDVEEFIDLYSELQKSLNAIAENGITVIPSSEQQRRYALALQSALEKIGDAIEIESERHTSLLTEEACGVHKANLTRAIDKISTIESLPIRFIEVLNSSLVKTDRVHEEIINNRKSQQCIAEIQRLYKTLSEMATQQDYVRIQEEIVALANTIPIVKDKDIYKTVIANIEEKQDSLVQQVIAWEVAYIAEMPRMQANVLKENISRQRNRYTDESSQKRLEELLQRLDNIILERQSEESEEKELQTLLSSAKGKLNDIKNLKNPIDSMKAYLQLLNTEVTSNQNGQQDLQDIKSEGFTVLTQKLSQVIDLCKRKLDQTKDYDQRKSALTKLHELAMSSDEFVSLRLNLIEGLQELENQNNILQNRLKDEQVMQSIRQHSLAKANTLQLCEDTIAEIEIAQQQLNYPKQFLEEIDKQVQAFRGKIIGYEESLKSIGEELIAVDDSNQLNRLRGKYHRLELIFKDSTQFSTYQQFENQISTLEEDIKVITQLQDLSSIERADSLSSCDQAITQIDLVRPTLLETERFAVKLQQLRDTLQQRKQNYLSKLTEFRDGLSNAPTAKEARQVRNLVGEATSFYQNSDESSNFESISTEADLLVGLLQLFESQKTDTPEDCARELDRLKKWQETNTEITSMLRSRVEVKLEELEIKRKELLTSQLRLSNAWFERIQQKRLLIEEISEQSEKITASNNLVKQIKKEHSKHEELLEESQKQYLEDTMTFCNDIQSLDREAKIFDLFQELPRAKRESLLKRLANHLYNPMENA